MPHERRFVFFSANKAKESHESWKTSCNENVCKLNSNLWQISRSFYKLLIGKSRQENVPPEDTLKAERDLNRQTRVHDSLGFHLSWTRLPERSAKETQANNRKCHSRQSCSTWQCDNSEFASQSWLNNRSWRWSEVFIILSDTLCLQKTHFFLPQWYAEHFSERCTS